jgi:hypothetical protein
MNVQVKDGLAAVRVGVDDNAVAGLGKAVIASDPGRRAQQMAQLSFVSLSSLIE